MKEFKEKCEREREREREETKKFKGELLKLKIETDSVLVATGCVSVLEVFRIELIRKKLFSCRDLRPLARHDVQRGHESFAICIDDPLQHVSSLDLYCLRDVLRLTCSLALLVDL